MKSISLLRDWNWLLALSVVLTALTLYMAFVWAPTEANQGAIQRSIYIHVPVAWVSMMAMVALAVFSIIYLRTGRARWDRLSAATAETGLVFGALMLLTGVIWARPVWGVWWTGEAKLTTALILFFIYVAYLMFRTYFPPGAQRQRLAAVIALIGAIDTPIIYWAANLWAEAHPPVIIGPARDTESAVGPEIGITMLVGAVSFFVLFLYIVVQRYRTRCAEDEVMELNRHVGATQAAGA